MESAGSMRSTNRSWVSLSVVVKPHATRPLCPRMVSGTPATVAPVNIRPGASIRARYQRPGARKPRWGSFASTGLPDAVCAPETAHEFDAETGRSSAGHTRTRPAKSVSIAPFASAVIVGGVSPSSPGHSSSMRSGGSRRDRRARNASVRQLLLRRIAISRPHTSESACRHGSGR